MKMYRIKVGLKLDYILIILFYLYDTMIGLVVLGENCIYEV